MGAMKKLYYEKKLTRKGGDDPAYARVIRNVWALASSPPAAPPVSHGQEATDGESDAKGRD